MLNILLAIPFPQSSDGEEVVGLLFGACSFIISIALIILILVGLWKMFEKAGQPGWASIIPIYNTYIILEIIGRPWWWLLLLLIPFVNIVVWLLVCIDVAKAFGKDALVWGFILLFLLSGVGFVMLGFSDAKYQGPVALG
ncbi:MAG: signal peptidase I [Anaerolineae bacterium]|nr:signal peptidase I [Anaerolineae bacterium]